MAAARRPLPVGPAIAGVFVAVAAWAGWVLSRHPDFQPVYMVRMAAPAVALVAGAAVTHRIAVWRAQTDVDGEFNPTGRSLFLGVVMLAVTVLAWLVAAQALPASLTALAGERRSEAGAVATKVALQPDPECRYRLEVSSASIARAMDECVPEAVWNGAAAGGPVALELLVSRFGAEIVGVAR